MVEIANIWHFFYIILSKKNKKLQDLKIILILIKYSINFILFYLFIIQIMDKNIKKKKTNPNLFERKIK